MNPTVHPLLLSAIDWDLVCPWLLFRKCLRMAFSFRLLFFTTLHLLIMTLWIVSAFGGFSHFRTVQDVLHDPISLIWAQKPADSVEINAFLQEDSLSQSYPGASTQVPAIQENAVTPFGKMMAEEFSETATENEVETMPDTVSEMVSESEERGMIVPILTKPEPLTAWGMTNRVLAVVYSLLGTLFWVMTITRMSALKIARDKRSYLRTETRFTLSRFGTVLSAFFMMCVGITLLGLPLVLCRFLPLSVLAWMTAPALIYTVFYSIFLIGTILGTLFIPCALMTENSDTFDALSRSYAYVIQRPLRFVFYLLAACVFGALGFVAIKALTVLVVYVFTGLSAFSLAEHSAQQAGVVVGLFVETLKWVIFAYIVVYFVSMIQGMYLLLRRDVDAEELEVIWLPEMPGIPAPKLPELKAENKS